VCEKIAGYVAEEIPGAYHRLKSRFALSFIEGVLVCLRYCWR